MSYKVFLFGPMRVINDEETLRLPSSVQARSLLAYLLINKAKTHARLSVIGILWPEMEETLALRSLSQALWQIKKTTPNIIGADRQSIWVKDASIWVDIEEFQELSKNDLTKYVNDQSGTGFHGSADATHQNFQQAISLYKGELLEGLYVDWILALRERMRETYLVILGQAISLEKKAGNFQKAIAFGKLLVQEDPLREEVHCELMRLYVLLDQPQSAIKQFETCRQILLDELGSEPDNETISLAKEISQRSSIGSTSSQKITSQLPTKTGGEKFLQKLPLIGRDEERKILLNNVDRMFNGEGWTVLVEGEAGIGKTRLIEEIASDIEWRGGQVLRGGGREKEIIPPYGPLFEALRYGLSPLRTGQLCQMVAKPWLQVLKPFIPKLTAILPELLPAPQLDPDQEQPRLLEAIIHLLKEWSKIIPLVLVLENLHWFDRDTLDLLPSLVSRVGDIGMLLVITFRSEEARAYPPLWEELQAIDAVGKQQRLQLTRLSESATGELIRRYLGSEQEAPIFTSRIFRETEGNPLFILETLRTLYDEGILFRDTDGSWSTPWDETTIDYAELPLPPVVERVIARRLDRVDTEMRQVLNASAVIGNRFDFNWLSASSGMETSNLVRITSELVGRHFWIETPQDYSFIHDKIRQVTYQAISPNERIRLHQSVGEALEKLRPENFTGLSYHYFEGQKWDKAAHYSLQAGDQAAAIFANKEALALYDRGLESLEKLEGTYQPSLEFPIRLAREKIYARLGEREIQSEELKTLEKLAGHSGENEQEINCNQAEVALRKAQFSEATGDYPASVTAAQAAIQHAQIAKDKNIEAAGYLEWGVGLWRQAEYKASQPQLAQALELARSVNAGPLEADSLRNLGNICWFQGDYSGAIDYYEKTLDACRRISDPLGEARTLNNLGLIAEHQGDNVNAREYYMRALTIQREVGDRRGESNTFANLANIDLYQGDYIHAMSNYELALPIRQAVADREGEAIVLTNLGIVWNHLGNYTKSKEYYEQALRVFRDHENRWGEGYLLAYLGLRAHQMGENEAAIALCEQAMQIANELDSPEHLANALTFYGHMLADLERFDESFQAYQQAIALRKELGQSYLVVETQAGLARLLLMKGDLSQARIEVDAILAHLETGSVDGTEEPARIYWTCYQVLCADSDPRSDDVLISAHSLVQNRADKIENPELRKSYLENVAAHREIEAAYRHHQEAKISIQLPSVEAPTGRPLRSGEWVDVVWSIDASEDSVFKGKTALRHHRLQRLLDEAYSQGAAPTVADLADVLKVSPATIKRDLAALRKSGFQVQTRGSRERSTNEPKV